ncbi:MAG: Plastocyanin [Parcubacteria group bacterium GW2011_GWA1_47_8]|nr:MAG: Plastocyanin [Parcubacteria group bacterium GW2011_GWA1_47_8]KKW07137.1 MAG: Plastocyanin [Parcubacteria group bacterium GW2011_GWA2_49_16]
MKNSILVVGIIVIIFGAFFLFTKESSAPAPLDVAPIVNTEATTTITASSQEAVTATVKEFTVTGQNFVFLPATLSVKKGDRVKIIFKNTGGFHGFKIDEFGVASKQINGGQEETLEFVADKTGSFEYYCSVGKHRSMGMKGALTVTE